MYILAGKGILLIFSILNLSMEPFTWQGIAALNCVICISFLCSYFEGRHVKYLSLLYLPLCIWRKEFLLFLPVLVYDAAFWQKKYLFALFLLPFLFPPNDLFLRQTVFLLTLCLLAVIFFIIYRQFAQLRIGFVQMRDEMREKELELIFKNRDLMEKQDYEVRLATLTERNRIAREIHDNVGHLLTRSLLQIGAMQVVYGDNEELRETLLGIKNTLSDAMNSIRSSVHDLHDESADLELCLRETIDGFSFCEVKLKYDVQHVPGDLTYTFLAIVKEALSNVVRHSNATLVQITVFEHPALYQLVIEDNGSKRQKNENGGMGLRNMQERLVAFGGMFRIETQNGYRIFISVPKQAEK